MTIINSLYNNIPLTCLCLKENSTITHMDISHNEISDIGGIALAKALGTVIVWAINNVSSIKNS